MVNEKIKKVEKFLKNNDISILYRYTDPNILYSKKYNIITDGIICDYNEVCNVVKNSTIVCNIIKDTKVIFIWTEDRDTIVDYSIIKQICKQFDIKEYKNIFSIKDYIFSI